MSMVLFVTLLCAYVMMILCSGPDRRMPQLKGALECSHSAATSARQDAATKVQELNKMNFLCKGGRALTSQSPITELLMTIESHRCRPAADRLRLTKRRSSDLILHSARQRASDAQYTDAILT